MPDLETVIAKTNIKSVAIKLETASSNVDIVANWSTLKSM